MTDYHYYDDESDRRKKLSPSKILLDLGLKRGDSILDIGAGMGYFTFPASLIVGNEGRVYAVDKSKSMINYLKKYNSQYNNLMVIHSDVKDISKFVDFKLDYILLSHTLHEIDYREEIITKLKKLLKKDGKVIIIDFDYMETKFGVATEHRLAKDDAISYLYDSGFSHLYDYLLSGSEYCIMAKA